MRGLFITGTDTGVGKTSVSAAVVRACRSAGIRVGAYKPVCTGCEIDERGNEFWPDVEILSCALGHSASTDRICPQRFSAPLAPPSSAHQEGRAVDWNLLLGGVERWHEHVDLLVIEGVGGLLCPLAEGRTVADFASLLGFPLVIVAALKLGAINHTLLTIELARQRKLPLAGLLLNQVTPADPSVDSCIEEITARASAPILGLLPFQEATELRHDRVISRIDWWNIACPPPSPLEPLSNVDAP